MLTANQAVADAGDPLPPLAAACRTRGGWFHVDGVYGGVAARVPGVPAGPTALVAIVASVGRAIEADLRADVVPPSR